MLLAVARVVFLAAAYQHSVRVDLEFGLLAFGEMALLVSLAVVSSAFLVDGAARGKRLAGAGYLGAAGYVATALANGPVLTVPHTPSVVLWLYGGVTLSALARGTAVLIAARAFSRSAVASGALDRSRRDGLLALASAVFALSALLSLIGWSADAANTSRAGLTVLGEGVELLAATVAAVAFLVSSLGAASDKSRWQRSQLLTAAGRAFVVAFLLLMLSEFIVAPHANLSAASAAERWLGTVAYAASVVGAIFATVGLTVARGRRAHTVEPRPSIFAS